MSRKALLSVAVAALLVGTASVALASGSPVEARFTRYGFSLRYPATWTRVNWCWSGHETPIALLTSAASAPKCPKPKVGVPMSFPPAQKLGRGEMSLYISQLLLSVSAKPPKWHARIGGRPAEVARPSYGDKRDTAVTCPAGARREYRYAAVEQHRAVLIQVEAIMCGPDLASENVTFRQVLNSIRFTR